MANSEFIHAVDITTGVISRVPRDWLKLFPTLTECDPDEKCSECEIIEPVDELAEVVETEPAPKRKTK